MLPRAMQHPVRERPALALRLVGLLLGGLALPGTIVFTVSLMLAVNGMLRFGVRYAEVQGMGWLWRPEGWLPLVGLGVAVLLLRMPEAAAARLMRRLVR